MEDETMLQQIDIFGKTKMDERTRLKHMVADAPTVEERKTGEWIRHTEIKNIYGGTCIECPACGEKYVVQHIEDEKFCRNCGADMRQGGQDEGSVE